MLLDVAFWVLGLVAVASAVLVFVVDSMARATYALALSFVAVGLALLLLEQSYVGVVTVLMMLMEMAVMGVYMVMYMGMNPALMPMSMVHDNRAALGVSAATFVVLAAGALLVPWPVRRGVPAPDVTAALGEALMGRQMLVMVVVSPVMVATIVTGVVLAAGRTRYDRFGDDLDASPPRDPHRGGVGR
ncbi:NADH-quinone oxidoreductase subunit J [Phycicoccus flavus]|uniref:NADH-quinone oxidoreductase subunit J n=1 Tax=Phycicoccus flavus TaxID=2502783 RepID=UPI000FEB666F|nr:NADH-quinone oxidoreductase subunit J [Phycicoccus flavus]NHA67663.1 NADH:ubiquinone oxidoreductase subunit J [Phycicoccus flavus]